MIKLREGEYEKECESMHDNSEFLSNKSNERELQKEKHSEERI
jgi:hypothetical protein